jgi:hypothetical protein
MLPEFDHEMATRKTLDVFPEDKLDWLRTKTDETGGEARCRAPNFGTMAIKMDRGPRPAATSPSIATARNDADAFDKAVPPG